MVWDHEDEDPDLKWFIDIDEELKALAAMGPDAYIYLVNEEPRPKLSRKIAEKIALSISLLWEHHGGRVEIMEHQDVLALTLAEFYNHVQLT